MHRRAALFDMDRTLVRRNTPTLYLRYQRETGELTVMQSLQASWWLLLYAVGMLDAPQVAEKALLQYAGRAESELYDSCANWFQDYVLPYVTESGRRAVERHRAAGDWVAIVTGGLRFAAEPLARELGIDHVVCTEVEVEDGRLTGRSKGLCYGSSKIDLAGQRASLDGVSLEGGTFYSDSISDLPLLEKVASPVVVNPDQRLRRIARSRGWPIEMW